jgi:hypothetical protein
LNAGAAQSLSVTFTPTDAANYTTATKSVSINVTTATPALTWSTPADIVYGAVLSAAQLNATTSVAGTFAYTPAAGTQLSAGTHTLSVTFTPTDAANYTTRTTTVAITVGKATPTVTWNGPADITYGTALSATQLNATASVLGTFAYTPAAGIVLNAGGQSLSVTFTPADATNYASATATAPLTVTPAAAGITVTGGQFVYNTVPHPATGTATGGGGASVAGSFSFTYVPGGSAAPVNAGSYSVAAIFTSGDANYSGGSGTATVTIDRAVPDPAWATPADIVYGTPLGPGQLNALADIPGNYVYTPPAGTVLPAGTGRVLSMTFTPADPNYTSYTESVSINVVKATPLITWSAPADLVAGTALSVAQLNATASVPGTFVYTPGAATVLPVGVGQTLSVTFTPTDSANYVSTTKTVAITVKGLPSITASPTNVGGGATVTATVANGPGNRTDWVALYAAGASTYLDWKYLNGSQVPPAGALTGAAVPFTLPTVSGAYTLKFYAGSTLLATSGTITVAATTLAVSATTVAPGGIVTATISNGPGNAKDWVGVYTAGGSTLFDWKYLNGSQTAPPTGVSSAAVDLAMPTIPGTYTVRLSVNGALLAESALITVGVAANPTVTPSTTTVTPGGIVTATIANGPGNARDWVALYIAGDSNYLDWKYLNGTQVVPATGVTGAAVPFTMPITQGAYTLRFYTGSTLLATSATITVATSSNITLTVNTTSVAPGATVTATVANGPGIRTDWIGLYPEGASTYLDWKYLNGSQTAPATALTSATVTIAMPTTPGNYILRFYSASTLIASSATVTVTVSGSSITPNATLIAPGGTVSATVANGPGNRTDWVALYAGDATTYLEWKYLNGSQVAPVTGLTGATVPFTTSLAPGTYTLRFFSGSTLLAASASITVGGTTFTVSTTTVAPGASLTMTIANGPGNPRDWVGLYPTNGSTLLDWKYLNGSQTAPTQGLTAAVVTFLMPSTPGAYTLRFTTGSTILASSPNLTVQ